MAAADLRIGFEDLRTFVRGVLLKEGLNADDTEAVTDGLCEASLRGIDTHGISLLEHYVANLRGGGVNKAPRFAIHSPFPAIAVLDADDGFGLAAGRAAIRHAMGVAKTLGLCAVHVRNSTHCGAMSYFTLMAAREGYLCLAMTNTDPKMLSTHGVRAYFGTNPIAVAAPRAGGGPPFSYDAATTAIPFNKVMVQRRAHGVLPPGKAADKDGVETTDPFKAVYLQPFGDYKGYGLAAIVEVLCAVASAMPFGQHLKPMYGDDARPTDKRNVSHFFLVMRPDATDLVNSRSMDTAADADAATTPPPPPHGTSRLDDDTLAAGALRASGAAGSSETAVPVWAAGGFQDRMRTMTDEVHAEPAAAGHESVMLPGDPQEHMAEDRSLHGVPIPPETAVVFARLGAETGVVALYR